MKTKPIEKGSRRTLLITNIWLYWWLPPPLTAHKSNALVILPTANNSRTD